MELPKDPNILVGMINMKLRDGGFSSLSDLCLTLGLDEKQLGKTLEDAGFVYMPEIMQFR